MTIVWAVVVVGVVLLVLPRGRDEIAPRGLATTAPPTPAEAPGSVSSLANLGNLAMQDRASDPEALDRALGYFERGHQLDPGNLNARFGLAWSRQVKGLPESQWRGLYQETVAKASLLTYLSLFNLAYAEQQAGRYPEAAVFMAHGLRVMPERADGWMQAGTIYLAMGEHARAIADLQTATELDPDSSRAFYLLGQAHSHLGQDAEAEAAWSRALQLNPALKEPIEGARAG